MVVKGGILPREGIYSEVSPTKKGQFQQDIAPQGELPDFSVYLLLFFFRGYLSALRRNQEVLPRRRAYCEGIINVGEWSLSHGWTLSETLEAARDSIGEIKNYRGEANVMGRVLSNFEKLLSESGF